MHHLQPISASVRGFFRRHKTVIALGFFYTVTRLLASLFLQMTFAPYGPGFGQFLNQGGASTGATRVSRFIALDLPPNQTVETTFGCCLEEHRVTEDLL